MRKHLNNPWIVAGLALAAVVLVLASLKSDQSRALPASEEPGTLATGESELPVAETSVEDRATLIATVLRELPPPAKSADPFASRPKEVSEVGLEDQTVVNDSVDTVRLSAIWTQEGRTYVLINGRIHEAGDEIARFKIESVTQDGVWVAHWKGRDFLPVGSDFTLVTPGQKTLTAASL